MAIKALFWDLAGVLLHTVHGTFNSLLAERLDADIRDIERIINGEQNNRWDLGEIDDDAFFTYLLAELGMPPEKKAILAHFVRYDFHIDRELLDFILSLKNRYTNLLITNFPSHVHDYLDSDWITEGAFDHIVASCDVKLLKPDLRIYQYALDKAHCRPDEALFIDDRPVNVRAAYTLGIKGIIYQTTSQTILDLNDMLHLS